MRQKILIVEDNDAFRKTVRRLLSEEGYDVVDAATGKAGLLEAERASPALIILDLVLPGIKGMEVCAALKGSARTAATPILILTGNDRDGQEIACLDEGADDYLTKPVKSALLLARCRALLRRNAEGPKGRLEVGGLILDYGKKSVRRGDRDFPELTPKEFDLLYELARRSPEPADRDSLYRKVWGMEPPSEGSLKTVDVHARRIRLKLGWKADEWLTFVSGRGYRLEPPRR